MNGCYVDAFKEAFFVQPFGMLGIDSRTVSGFSVNKQRESFDQVLLGIVHDYP